MKRYSAPVIVLGLLTLIQLVNGLWRIGVMYQEGLRAGVRPLQFSGGLLEEIALSGLIALAAWWWLPRGERRAAAWALRFLAFAWLLALSHLVWAFQLGFFERGVTWAVLLILFVLGIPGRVASAGVQPQSFTAVEGKRHPAAVGAFIFWVLQLPHLFFPYHWTDTKDTWACRAAAFDASGGMQGIFDCLDPARPPLHSILLWLGYTNGTIEGRLLPFLMVGAFGLVLYHFVRRVAPTLAPWALLWFFMTVRVYQGAVSNYADVPVMIAITLGIFLALDQDLVPSRWHAIIFAVLAGAAAALIKRDGGALVVVATGITWWFHHRRREPRLYAALAGAVAGFALWSMRPEALHAPAVFDLRFSSIEAPALPIHLVSQAEPGASEPDPTRATAQTYVTMFYGMQGQILSHYGFSMFVPAWIILGIWVWRRNEPLSPEARLYTWLAILGWLAIVGMYVVHVSTGHPYRGSLHVIRTAFGRHLVHMFAFTLLSAAALAQVLLAPARSRAP
jgi:hypothetical protein